MRISSLGLIGALAATLGMVGVASAADPKPYPLTATSNGKSYKQVVTEYVKWSVANDGAKGCDGLPQPASPIVFLASVNGKGKYSFSCSFPAGSKILMLGGFNLCWTDAKTSLADLPKQCAPSSLAAVTRARATIDGVPINIRQYLVTSSIVKASLPKGNTFGIKEPSTSFLDHRVVPPPAAARTWQAHAPRHHRCQELRDHRRHLSHHDHRVSPTPSLRVASVLPRARDP